MHLHTFAYVRCFRVQCKAICSTVWCRSVYTNQQKISHRWTKKGENAKQREKIHSEREIRWMKSLDKINEKGFKTRNLLWLKRVFDVSVRLCFENERPISFLFMDFPFKINDSVSLRWDFWISPYIYLRCCRYIVVHEFLCRGAFCFFINKSVEPLTKSHLIWDQAMNWFVRKISILDRCFYVFFGGNCRHRSNEINLWKRTECGPARSLALALWSTLIIWGFCAIALKSLYLDTTKCSISMNARSMPMKIKVSQLSSFSTVNVCDRNKARSESEWESALCAFVY